MKRPLVFLEILLALVMGGLLLGTAMGREKAPPKEFSLLVSFGSGPAWYPGIEEGNEGPLKEYKDQIVKLRSKYPEDIPLVLGGFTTPTAARESTYDSPFVDFYFDQGFEAVNVTTQDYINYGATQMGYRYLKPDHEDFFIGSIDQVLPGLEQIRPAKTLDRDGLLVHLASVSDPEKLSGIPQMAEEATTLDPQEVIEDAVDAGDGLTILLSDYDAATNDEFARRFPGLDLVLETGIGDGKVRQVGSTWIAPRSDETELMRLKADLGKEGRIEDLDVDTYRWANEGEYEALLRVEQPLIGVSVRPPGRIADRFNISEEQIQVDLVREVSYPDLTTRSPIFVYHLSADGVKYRLYRLHHVRGYGWMVIDKLVLLNPDHTIRRIVTNDPHYMVLNYPTKLAGEIQAIYNKPPNQWEIPPDALLGYETQAKVLLDDLRKVIELDRRLYPDSDI